LDLFPLRYVLYVTHTFTLPFCSYAFVYHTLRLRLPVVVVGYVARFAVYGYVVTFYVTFSFVVVGFTFVTLLRLRLRYTHVCLLRFTVGYTPSLFTTRSLRLPRSLTLVYGYVPVWLRLPVTHVYTLRLRWLRTRTYTFTPHHTLLGLHTTLFTFTRLHIYSLPLRLVVTFTHVGYALRLRLRLRVAFLRFLAVTRCVTFYAHVYVWFDFTLRFGYVTHVGLRYVGCWLRFTFCSFAFTLILRCSLRLYVCILRSRLPVGLVTFTAFTHVPGYAVRFCTRTLRVYTTVHVLPHVYVDLVVDFTTILHLPHRTYTVLPHILHAVPFYTHTLPHHGYTFVHTGCVYVCYRTLRLRLHTHTHTHRSATPVGFTHTRYILRLHGYVRYVDLPVTLRTVTLHTPVYRLRVYARLAFLPSFLPSCSLVSRFPTVTRDTVTGYTRLPRVHYVYVYVC